MHSYIRKQCKNLETNMDIGYYIDILDTSDFINMKIFLKKL